MKTDLTSYTKGLLILLLILFGLANIDLPFVNTIFIFISVVTCFIYSPVMLIMTILTEKIKLREKTFLIVSFISINSVLLISVLWGIYREVHISYFLISIFLLITSEFSYWRYCDLDSRSGFIKAIYFQRLIVTTLLLLIALLIN